MVNIPVFFEAERFIREVEFDIFHSINNPNHKNHEVCQKAFVKLKSKVAKARAELEAQRFFDN
jgi:predicted aspartyl protease